ncbi:hypothetical protein [Adoxophyes orana nucleopolyhedrovirus]|uniref:hypothetical protein n=1 Tax=Adoxophyes orana nucleopolyhedrovirus TaxID=542343 RepID=UPI0001829C1F|nr:hypothetical protein [Adoxophyes orana nucleopolyhedrovirus]ACF05372.1 hypothetical protein [Adoxophyes orana nucleopolyhedrovirus]
MNYTAAQYTNNSILYADQLTQLINRNRSFFKDYLLIVCAFVMIVMITLLVLMLLIVFKQKSERIETYASNLDYRMRQQ